MKIAVMSFAHVHSQVYVRLLGSDPSIEVMTSDPLYSSRPQHETGGAAMAADLEVPYVDTYSELMAWGPDGVIICSENSRHREDVELAAAAGAQILCEKPIATTLDDASAMIRTCEQAGVKLMIAYPVRYSPSFVALRKTCDAGVLGSLRGLHGANNGGVPADRRAWFVDPKMSGGGSLIDHVVHLADLYDELLGHLPAESVYAAANGRMPGAPVGVETAAQVSVRYPGGIVATIDSSWLVPKHAPTWGGLILDVIGDQGFASMDAFNQRVDGYSELEQRPVWLSYAVNLDKIMVDTFVDVVRTGATPPVDGAAGYRSMAVALAALESVRTGQPAEVGSLG